MPHALCALLTLCALASTLATPTLAQGPPVAPLSLDDAIARAQSANPAIVAAERRRGTSLGAVEVARERLNPEARVEFERETPTRAYGIALPIETGGKRQRRIEVSQAGIGVSDAELARTRLDIRVAVRRAYFSRLEAEARRSLLRELQELAMRVLAAAQQRFDAGSSPRLEVLLAALARSEAENQATAAEGAATAARVQLNVVLALPHDHEMELATPLGVGPSANAAELLSRANAVNTEIAIFDRRLEEQRARIALAVALQKPDVTPEATITRGNEPDFGTGWRLGVSVAVPVFTRHRAGVRLEEAVLTQLTAERDAALARIAGEVTAATALANAQREQYLRYRDAIVPQAIEVQQMAEDSYRLGQTGIAAYLQALQVSRDVRLRMVQAAFDYQAALTELERTIGAPTP